MKKILMIAYAKKNLGDDLFIYILANRYVNTKFYLCAKIKYKNKWFNTKNLKFVNPFVVKKLYGVSNSLNTPKFNCNNVIANFCDSIVFIGGSIFIQNADVTTCKKYLEERFSHLNKDYYILGSNFGPYTDNEYIDMYKDVFKNAKDVCFREEYSYNLFKDLENVRYAADIVFSMDVSDIQVVDNKRVVISVIDLKDRKDLSKYKEVYENKIKESIEYFTSIGYEVTLMSFCEIEGDMDAINSILNLVEDKEKVRVYNYDGNIKEALNVIASCSIVIASRFHAKILALLFNKTVIPMVYSEKTINVMNDIEFKGEYVKIEEIDGFDITKLSEADLNHKTDISNRIKDANRHFEILDRYLKE